MLGTCGDRDRRTRSAIDRRRRHRLTLCILSPADHASGFRPDRTAVITTSRDGGRSAFEPVDTIRRRGLASRVPSPTHNRVASFLDRAAVIPADRDCRSGSFDSVDTRWRHRPLVPVVSPANDCMGSRLDGAPMENCQRNRGRTALHAIQRRGDRDQLVGAELQIATSPADYGAGAGLNGARMQYARADTDCAEVFVGHGRGRACFPVEVASPADYGVAAFRDRAGVISPPRDRDCSSLRPVHRRRWQGSPSTHSASSNRFLACSHEECAGSRGDRAPCLRSVRPISAHPRDQGWASRRYAISFCAICSNADFGRAPVICSTTWPSRKARMVGMARTP